MNVCNATEWYTLKSQDSLQKKKERKKERKLDLRKKTKR